MKKIIFVVLLLIAGFFVWRYFKNPQRKTTAPEQGVDAVVNYVPNAIERKSTLENKVNDSARLENERLQKAMEEIQ